MVVSSENMEAATARLMRCPFCGSRGELTTSRIEEGWWCADVMCTGVYGHGCSAQMIAGGDTEEDAVDAVIELWNRRAR